MEGNNPVDVAIASALSNVLANESFWDTVDYYIARYNYDAINIDLDKVAMSMLSITDPISQVVHAISQIIESLFEAVKNAVESAVSAIANNVIRPAIQAVHAAVNDLIETAKRIPDVITSFANTVSSMVSSFASNLSKIAEAMAQNVLSAVQSLRTALVGVVEDIRNAITNLPSTIKNVIKDALLAYIKVIRLITDYLRQALPSLANAIRGMFESMRNALEEVVNEIMQGISKAVGPVYQFAAKVYQALSNTLGPILSQILSFLQSSVVPILNNVWVGITNLVAKFDEAMEYLGKLVERLMDAVGAVASQVQGIISNSMSSLVDAISKLGNTITSSISSLASSLMNAIRNLPAQVVSAITQAEDFIQRVGAAAASALSSALASLRQALASAFSALSSAANAIISSLSNLGRTITSALSSAINWLGNALARLGNNIIQALSTVYNYISQAVGSAVNTISSFVSSAISTISNIISNVANAIQGGISNIINIVSGIPKALGQLFNVISNDVMNAINFVVSGINKIAGFLGNLPNQIASAVTNAINTIMDTLKSIYQAIVNLPNEVIGAINELKEAIASLLAHNTEQQRAYTAQAVKQVVVSEVAPKVEQLEKGLFQLNKNLQNAIVPNSVCKLDYNTFKKEIDMELSKLEKEITKNAEKLLEERLKGLQKWLGEKNLEPINKNLTTVAGVLHNATQVLQHQSSILANIGGWIQNATNSLTGFFNALGNIYNWISTNLAKLPELIDGLLNVLKDPAKLVMDIIDEIVKGASDIISNFVSQAFDLIKKAIDAINDFVNTTLTQMLLDIMGSTFNAAANIAQKFFQGVVNALGYFVNTTTNTIKGSIFAAESIVRTFSSSIGKVNELISKGLSPSSAFAMPIALSISIGDSFIPQYVVGLGLAAALISVLSKAVDLEMDLTLFGLGTKLRLSDIFGPIASAIRYMATTIARDTLMAFSFGVSYNMLKPIDYAFRAFFVNYFDSYVTSMYRSIIPAGWASNALINAFAEAPAISAITDLARRLMAVDLVRMNPQDALMSLINNSYPHYVSLIINTIRSHMVLRGLPKWFIELYTKTDLAVEWTDRFGNKAYFLLGKLFELPTHSELARMTIKDIIPSINLMLSLGWLRGWPPDVTRSIYLMHFKYPSFEKLLKFYYRAISGMLWYNPPPQVYQLFSAEAKALGTDSPISPLAIAMRLGTPEAVKALETALGAYFKWLEYSNFPWISRNTVVNGVPIGQMVYSVLGGWTADSWLLADIAADIPGKIDQRWMSRYGIFLLMTEKGWDPKSPTPLVFVLPQLLEQAPQSKIMIDLTAHSKLLQATGLHPVWVPITTVAENIMVISDEMTLMRTGWLNLFKHGLLTKEQVEEYLSGILKVSYKTLYFDPVKRQWKDAWLTVPVRWLPHERRLLQVRFVIDRVMNLFKELYGYLRSAVRNLALPVEGGYSASVQIDGETISVTYKGMKEILYEYVDALNKYFSKAMSEITGVPMHIGIDKEFIDMWLNLEKTAKQIEAMVKARYYWYRLSGYLLYRLAYGFVKFGEVKKLVDDVASIIPMTDEEKALYLIIMKYVTGIMAREYIPTPAQLATIAEDVPSVIAEFEDEFLKTGKIPDDSLIAKVFKERNVPKEWWPIWARYVIVHARRDEVRRILTEMINLYAHKLITKDYIDELYNEVLSKYGVDEKEMELILTAAEMRKKYVWLWQRYVGGTPTVNELARLWSYLGKALELSVRPTFPGIQGNVTLEDLVYQVRGVPEEWRPIWKAYVRLTNVMDEVRRIVARLLTAYGRGAIKTKDEFMQALDQVESKLHQLLPAEIARAVPNTGWLFTTEERELLFTAAELTRKYDEMRNILPTPMQLATIAESVPEVIEKLDELMEYQFYPKPYDEILRNYVIRRRFADEKRLLERAIARALAAGYTMNDIAQVLQQTASAFGFTSVGDLLKYIGLSTEEIELARARYEIESKFASADEVARAWRPTPLTLANMLEIVKIPQALIENYNIDEQFKQYVIKYVTLKPYVDDFRKVVNYYYAAITYNYVYGADVTNKMGNLIGQVTTWFNTFNFDDTEQQMANAYAALRALYERARRGYAASVPTFNELANVSEYVPSAKNLVYELINHYMTPEPWASIWVQYVSTKPIANEVRQLLREAVRAYAYEAITNDELSQVLAFAKNYGWTDEELSAIRQMAELYRRYVIARMEGREYVPTPTQLASIVEYVPSAKSLLNEVLKARKVPREWWPIWQKYVAVRPLADEIRRLLTAAINAYAQGVIDSLAFNQVLNFAKNYGWTDDELSILKQIAELRKEVIEGREQAREYIPTPYQLATIAEYVPSARKMIDEVLKARNVPSEWADIWRAYVTIRPVYDEIRRFVTELINMYARFEINDDALTQLLNVLTNYGLDKLEVQIIEKLAKMRAADYAWRELVGTPRNLASMAEYSPTARKVALAYVYRIIDALPVDQNTKELIKSMWEEYVRVRPVYDEVRRYVTELVNDYAEGVIDQATLQNELEALKDWGLDDYEVQFYLWLAERRRQRYLLRRLRG